MPTLRQFATVDWVKIYGPGGHTAVAERPVGLDPGLPQPVGVPNIASSL